MSTAIKVENLSKRYYLSHNQKERFPTLRDALAAKVHEYGMRLLHPLKASTVQPLVDSCRTEEFWALKEVSFDVKQGDRIGIIGRNGAGKSTLLKILSRIADPTAGRISLKGRVASLLEVGTGFHPELTGRENIFLNGAILGMGKHEIRRKFDEIVDFAEVEKFLDTPVKRYSSGMYVRLAFAVAAHLEPDILIVDEVLAVGDALFQEKCLTRLEGVTEEGRTVLFVSHNMAAISKICNRGMLLKDGQIAISGGIQECVDLYVESSERVFYSLWEGCEGDELFTLRKISIEQPSYLGGYFVTHEDINVEMEYDLREDVKGFIAGVFIRSVHGDLIAYSRIDDCLEDNEFYAKKGKHKINLVIPGNTFSQGSFIFEFDFGVHNIKRFIEKVFTIKMMNVDGIGLKYLTGKGLENIFRPKFLWK